MQADSCLRLHRWFTLWLYDETGVYKHFTAQTNKEKQWENYRKRVIRFFLPLQPPVLQVLPLLRVRL
jgi:hypothetical protein